MRRYNEYGSVDIPYSDEQRRADMARIQAQDEARARDRRAWDRLCGMAAPIGRPVDL